MTRIFYGTCRRFQPLYPRKVSHYVKNIRKHFQAGNSVKGKMLWYESQLKKNFDKTRTNILTH